MSVNLFCFTLELILEHIKKGHNISNFFNNSLINIINNVIWNYRKSDS